MQQTSYYFKIKNVLASLIIAFSAALACAEKVVESPFGVYRLISQITGNAYHLVITEEASLLTNNGAYLMEIPKNCGKPSVKDPPIQSIYYLRPFWNANLSEFTARGSTARDANSVFVRFQDANHMEGHFLTTNFSFAPAMGDDGLRPIPFLGTRIAIEEELQTKAEKSILNLSTFAVRDDAQGIYSGALPDGTKIRLVLTLISDHSNIEHWGARLDFGTYVNVPMTSNAPRNGLLRLVRFPGLDPRWTSGLTGTVVTDENGKLEFHGYYFVVRNGCITPLRLKKTINARNK